MGRDKPVEDLEDFLDAVSGPMRPVFQEAGSIILKKLRERGTKLKDLPNAELEPMIQAALHQAMASMEPGVDLEALTATVARHFAEARLDAAGNAEGSEAMH